MTVEVTVLALAGLLQAVQYVLFALPANLELGLGYTTSARDRPPSRQMSETTLRMQRAMNNMFEALMSFTIAVVVVTLGNQSSTLTEACAWTFLAARIAYIPAYRYGWRPWRSLIWLLGYGASLVMILAALV